MGRHTDLFGHLSPEQEHELDPRKFEIGSIMLVGAEIDKGLLGHVDRSVLRAALSIVERLKLPVGADVESLYEVRDSAYTPDHPALIVKNPQPEHGGDDFLLNPGSANLLVFCNIPVNFKGHYKTASAGSFSGSKIRGETMQMWRDARMETGAQYTMLFGGDTDCHRVDDLYSPGDVVISPRPSNGFQMLFSREVFSDLNVWAGYLRNDSLMSKMCARLSASPSSNHFELWSESWLDERNKAQSRLRVREGDLFSPKPFQSYTSEL